MGLPDNFDADDEVLRLLQLYEETGALPDRIPSTTAVSDIDLYCKDAASYEDAFAAFQEQLEKNTTQLCCLGFMEEQFTEDGAFGLAHAFAGPVESAQTATPKAQLSRTLYPVFSVSPLSSAALDLQERSSNGKAPGLVMHPYGDRSEKCCSCSDDRASSALAVALANFQEQQHAYAARQAAAEAARAALQQRLADESAALMAQLEAQRRSNEELRTRAARRCIAAGRIGRAWKRYQAAQRQRQRTAAAMVVQAFVRRWLARRCSAALRQKRTKAERFKALLAGRAKAVLGKALAARLSYGEKVWEEQAQGKALSKQGSSAEAVLFKAARRGGAKVFAAALRKARASEDAAEASIAEAKRCFKLRQEEALQHLHSALPDAPAAAVSAMLAGARDLGLPEAPLAAAAERCAARDSRAAAALAAAAEATPYDARAHAAAAQRCAHLQLEADLQRGQRKIAQRQRVALEALNLTAAAADAAGFAAALAAARRLEAAQAPLAAAARLLEQRCAALCASSFSTASQFTEHGVNTAAVSSATIRVSEEDRDGVVPTEAEVAAIGGGKRLREVATLDLGLERLQSFGSALIGCTALVELHACSNRLNSIAGLDCCAALQVLTLSDNHISGLRGLSVLPRLRDLDVSLNRMRSLEGLKGCSSLQRLKVDGNKVQSFSTYLPAGGLSWLSLCDNQLTCLTGLAGCRDLQLLLVKGNWLANLAGLSACTQLRHLDVSFNLLGCFPAQHIASHHHLSHLSLNGNRIETLPQLPYLPALELLYLQENSITALQPMSSNLPYLGLVNLSFNQLSHPQDTLAALRLLPRLQELYLNGNALQTHPKYAAARARLLPQLEREHDHSQVAAEDMERRLTNALARSRHTPRALLAWQARGRGHPCLLPPLMRADRSGQQPPCMTETLRETSDGSRTINGTRCAAELVRHNMLARAHWALCSASASCAQREGSVEGVWEGLGGLSERSRSAVCIQAAWRGRAGRRAAAAERARRARSGPAADPALEQGVCAVAVGSREAYNVFCAWRREVAALRIARDGGAHSASRSGDGGIIISPAEDDDLSTEWVDCIDVERWLKALPGQGADGGQTHKCVLPNQEEDSAAQDDDAWSGGVCQDVNPPGMESGSPQFMANAWGASSETGGTAMQHGLGTSADEGRPATAKQTSGSQHQDREVLKSATAGEQQLWAWPDPDKWSRSVGDDVEGIMWDNDSLEEGQEEEAQDTALDAMCNEPYGTCSNAVSCVSTCSMTAFGNDARAPSDVFTACCSSKPETCRTLQPQRAEVQRIMQEWSFKDEATAEAFLKARKHQLRHKAASAKKRLLQDPNARLARLKAKMAVSSQSRDY